MGDPAFDDGRIPLFPGPGLVFRDRMAVPCEGGACYGYDICYTAEPPPSQDKEDLDVNEMDVKRVYLTIWDI